jgi:hypothetical protein
MTLTKALNILRHYQLWRLGDEITELQPKQLTEAINVVIQGKNIEPIFKSEDEAIAWVGRNIALAIQPKNKTKTMYIFPYISSYAHKVVVESLGKELFKHQQETLNDKQTTL